MGCVFQQAEWLPVTVRVTLVMQIPILHMITQFDPAMVNLLSCANSLMYLHVYWEKRSYVMLLKKYDIRNGSVGNTNITEM